MHIVRCNLPAQAKRWIKRRMQAGETRAKPVSKPSGEVDEVCSPLPAEYAVPAGNLREAAEQAVLRPASDSARLAAG